MTTHTTEQTPGFSPARIAELLTEPPKPTLTPTPEQVAVIQHPLGSSTLVVAGAGSGKTETMANRVVWLVANGLVAPDAVLGLTFTRKAAGELRERISGRLQRFAERLQDAVSRGTLNDWEAARVDALTAQLGDGLDMPDVSTYNAFAAGVLQEFGAAAGIAPGATIIDEATAWRIARDVVIGSDDPDLVGSEMSVSNLVAHLRNLDHAVADNLTSLDRVDQVVAEFARVAELPYNPKERDAGTRSGRVYAPVRDSIAALSETPLITRLARAYAAEKQHRGVLEFSDQLAYATRAIEQSADAVATIRRRHRVVLLDEVQDTSVGQTRFLAHLFHGMSVMAVGDPHQSIYGWRGASAEGLQSFHTDFAARGARGGGLAGAAPATLTLSTSWRNPSGVLDIANRIVRPLVADAAIPVPKLQPMPGAGAGTVEWRFPETAHEERLQVAEWMREARQQHLAAHGTLPTAAVILRNRRHMSHLSAALTDAGVPNRIVGLGGLLTTPEVTDVVAALRCVWYADASGDLIRILAGPRFALGARDIAGLRDAAAWLADRDAGLQHLSEEDRQADRVLADPDRAVTLVDALDRIADFRDLDHRAIAGVSAVGRERLREAGRLFRSLRQGVGGAISDLITQTIHALRLDIELDANEARPYAGTAAAHANLDTFIDLVENFLAVDSRGTLPSVLEWIERAREADEVAEHVAAPEPGTVHLITAHGSKGLEWDLVAVPRLVADEFPSKPKEGAGWLRTGQLPDDLRGDIAARPQLNWRIADTQQEVRDRIATYKQQLRARSDAEERRLAYVAVTRSADRLLMTGSFWGGQKTARQPSTYLLELQQPIQPVRDEPLEPREREPLITGLPLESAHETDPSEVDEFTLQWPLDPLGARGPAVRRAAGLVRDGLAAEDSEALGAAPIDNTVRLLLAERRAAEQRHRDEVRGALPDADLPARITASTFHEFVEDPVQAERRRLRPVPQRPYRRTRVGNQFHEWVERRSTTALGTAVPLAGIDDPGDTSDAEFFGEPDLQPLIEQFERSRWASSQPIEVEREVTLPFAGRTLVCKLDAVYRTPGAADDGGDDRFEIVDWKAGRPPRTDSERETRFFQLDLYRHAYAQWADVDPDRIDVSLFYVADGIELAGTTPRSLTDLEAIWWASAGTL